MTKGMTEVKDVVAGAMLELRQDAKAAPPEPERLQELSQDQVGVLVRSMGAQAGMNPRELTATWAQVPDQLKRALESRSCAESALMIRSGNRYPRGFGLAGGVGCGKTFALATIFLAGSDAVVRARYAKGARSAEVGRQWFHWVRWPQLVNELRIMSSRDNGLRDAEQQMRYLHTAPCLVLDDLGGERLKSYQDDWATTQLDLLIDGRYGEMMPTWYTTNLEVRQLAERYGGRMFSRLTGANPLVELKGAKDLRLAAVSHG
jgi:DNA replication protein DnaC